MKSWFILIVLAVFMTAAATFALPFLSKISPTEPRIPAPVKPEGPSPVATVMEDLTYDFGTLPQQYTGHRTWTFKNTGAGPLELRGAGTTCSCTTAALFSDDKKETKQIIVQPGESLPIEVTFQTKDWTKFNQTVTVGTNDPNSPMILLTVTGVAKPAISTSPSDASVNFGAVGNEGENTRRVAIFSQDRPDLILKKLTSTNPALIEATPRPFTPEEAKTFGAPKGYVIEIKLKPTSNLGAFAEEVLVETDHPQKSEVRFRFGGKVTGPITVLPERVTVWGATTKDGGTEPLKIVARGRTSVNFVVEKKPRDIDVSIEPITQPAGAKGSMYRMLVKVIPGAQSGRIVDEIVLKTDAPSASEVKIPVDVLVQGAK
jgi:Protein of unknown function (DUF1573)